jgi:hypothetical protein
MVDRTSQRFSASQGHRYRPRVVDNSSRESVVLNRGSVDPMIQPHLTW